jgi:hypothetical protein
VSDAICTELGPRGVRCERWNQPAAHWDGQHQAGDVAWPYVAPPRQLVLDLTDAATGAAPARQEASAWGTRT